MPIIGTTSSSESSEVPVTTSSEIASSGDVNIMNLLIGDYPITGYKLPNVIGSSGEILKVPPSGNDLIWGVGGGGGGGGDVINGGQSGLVSIGSNDNKLTIQGNQGITIIGGIEYQYNAINLISSIFNLLDIHYFIEITGSGNNTIVLPDADTRTGKIYIISKGYTGGSLTINTQTADKIDGDDTIVLNVLNERIQLISSGIDRWLII